MKTSGVLSVTLLSPLLFGVSTPNGLYGQSDPVLWTRQSANYGVAEFGINSLVGDAITQSPSVFEPGINVVDRIPYRAVRRGKHLSRRLRVFPVSGPRTRNAVPAHLGRRVGDGEPPEGKNLT